MKRTKTAIGVLGLGLVVTACAEKPLDKADLVTEQDRISYALGYEIGGNLSKQQMEFTLNALFQGIEDALEQNEPLLDPEERRQAREAFESLARNALVQDRAALAEKNEREGAEFLEKNKQREGVVTLSSGLQYQILTEGTGARPQLTDNVSVHYIGRFLDGSEFNNSYEAGNPVIFMVNGVIPGWSEALQLMRVGAKWRLWLPPNLGYGEQGAGAQIGPNATLVFEVELLSILE